MIKFGFNGGKKPRTFGYIPRFYNPAKEELEEILAKYKPSEEKKEYDITQARLRISTNLRHRTGDKTPATTYQKEQVIASKIRLFVIIIALTIVFYAILHSDKLEAMIHAFTN